MATTALVAAVPALAQESSTSAQAPVGADAAAVNDDFEIVVTAQKREERLRDVPVSVTSLTAESLTQQNLVQMRDYYSRIPGMSLIGGLNEQRAASISLRGVTAGNVGAATVAFTVDDVPFTSSTAAAQSPLPDLDPGDLERVEVLRGPQGTLYGSSSLGGLIKFVTAPANTTDFSGRLEAGVSSVAHGDFGYSARGSVNVPIATDVVGLRISGFRRKDPGYIDNFNTRFTAKDVNDNVSEGGRAALTVTPADGLKITLAALTQRRKFFGSPSIVVQDNYDPLPLPAGADGFDPEFTNTVGPTSRVARFTQYQARVEADIGFADLTSISAWGIYKSASDVDLTIPFGFILPFYGLTPTTGAISIINADQNHKFSQEVRLASREGPLEWLVGGFYTNERINVSQILKLSDGREPFNSSSPTKFEEKAIFGNLTYHFNDRFDVQVGGRYGGYKQVSGSVTTVDPLAEPLFGPSSTDPDQSSSSNAFTWLITPRFRFSSDLMAYVRVASGYRIGGRNPTLPSIPATYGSDKVISYELGLKGVAPSASLSYDLSIFQVDWDDIQIAATDSVTQFNFFINGAKARSRGAELALQWRPAERLVIDANATFLDAVLTGDIARIPGSSVVFGFDGDRLPGSARFVGNLSAQKDWSIGGDAYIFGGASLSYVGGRYGEFSVASAATPRVKLPDYALVDMRAGVYNDDWSLSLYVRNLFDARTPLEATTSGGQTPLRAVFAQPRTIGATLVRKF